MNNEKSQYYLEGEAAWSNDNLDSKNPYKVNTIEYADWENGFVFAALKYLDNLTQKHE